MSKKNIANVALDLNCNPHQLCCDEESGLYHAGHFKASLELELIRLERNERSLALVVIEIADLNTSPLWAKAGAALLASLRSIDQGARLGPKIMAAILPDADEYRARRMIGEFLQNLSCDSLLKNLKTKFGLALAQPLAGDSPETLLQKAFLHASSDLGELALDGPPCPEPNTAIAADERSLLFDGFKRL